MISSFHRLAAAAAPFALGAILYGSPASADAPTLVPEQAIPTSGADLHIHNHTGSDVELYIFENASVHKTRAGGLHAGDIKDGGTGTAHVKACHFAVVLFHGSDAYHAEFNDCAITDITISASNK